MTGYQALPHQPSKALPHLPKPWPLPHHLNEEKRKNNKALLSLQKGPVQPTAAEQSQATSSQFPVSEQLPPLTQGLDQQSSKSTSIIIIVIIVVIVIRTVAAVGARPPGGTEAGELAVVLEELNAGASIGALPSVAGDVV